MNLEYIPIFSRTNILCRFPVSNPLWVRTEWYLWNCMPSYRPMGRVLSRHNFYLSGDFNCRLSHCQPFLLKIALHVLLAVNFTASPSSLIRKSFKILPQQNYKGCCLAVPLHAESDVEDMETITFWAMLVNFLG